MDATEWYSIEVRTDRPEWFALGSTYDTRTEADEAYAVAKAGARIRDARIVRHQTFRSIVEPPEPILQERTDACVSS